MKYITKYILVVLTGLLATSVSAENMKVLGNLNVHYIALSTTTIPPAVAKNYDIVRSKYKGFINIAVLDNSKQGNPAKKAALYGTAQNRVGQIKKLEFREVKEGKAIYYLAEISFQDRETYTFDINITDGIESHKLDFKQTFFVE